jgi:pentose-5-phosphate-3-epimerase
MIQVCPALLCSNISDFRDQLKKAADLFELIDVDLNIRGDSFYGDVTITPNEAFKEIRKYKNMFNIHLMVSKPAKILDSAKENGFDLSNYRILIHQESEFEAAIKNHKKFDFGIVVKAESELSDIKFYNKFPEVQLMTIVTGEQGNEFIPEVMNRVEWLRENGYKGVISLDGSMNLNSAQTVRDFDVNRVSVGSYFSNADDLALEKYKLDLALNMKLDN